MLTAGLGCLDSREESRDAAAECVCAGKNLNHFSSQVEHQDKGKSLVYLKKKGNLCQELACDVKIQERSQGLKDVSTY